ncbi:MAG: glycosyltransferase family 2 protein [Desulfobacterales bacterium]|nr:glycosyltransferase family 2 protein [Desulfobacterales bacterium]
MLTDKFISVVVACYRDEGSVDELLRRLTLTMEKITPNWEVIYVNDCSPDNAESILIEQAALNPRLTVISHARNFGAQVAFTTGMDQAVGDAIIIMDGDLQDPPEMIEKFVDIWLKGYEVVYGIRAKRHEGLVRNIGYKVFYRILQKIAYITIPLDAGEFSLMDRVVVDVILACPERDRLIRGLRAYAGFNQTGVEFERPSRFAGESTQSLLDYVMWVYKSFTSFSLAPLRIISVISLLMSGISLLALVTYIGVYFFYPKAPSGFMTLLVLGLGVGSVVMLSLGVMSEYIARLFLEIKARPQPVIRTLVNDHRPVPRPWLGRKVAILEQVKKVRDE